MPRTRTPLLARTLTMNRAAAPTFSESGGAAGSLASDWFPDPSQSLQNSPNQQPPLFLDSPNPRTPVGDDGDVESLFDCDWGTYNGSDDPGIFPFNSPCSAHGPGRSSNPPMPALPHASTVREYHPLLDGTPLDCLDTT
jgi:hypothetical protein